MLLWKQVSAQQILFLLLKDKGKELSCLKIDTWSLKSVRPYVVQIQDPGSKDIFLLGVCIITHSRGSSASPYVWLYSHLNVIKRETDYEFLGMAEGKYYSVGTDLICLYLSLCCENACDSVIFSPNVFEISFKEISFPVSLWQSMERPQNIRLEAIFTYKQDSIL